MAIEKWHLYFYNNERKKKKKMTGFLIDKQDFKVESDKLQLPD